MAWGEKWLACWSCDGVGTWYTYNPCRGQVLPEGLGGSQHPNSQGDPLETDGLIEPVRDENRPGGIRWTRVRGPSQGFSTG